MIRVEDATLSIGGEELLVGASLHVRPGDKVALVGRNGSGKTTLLRAIAGELHPDHGKITIRGDAQLGWLPQTAVSGSDKSVWDEARSRMATIESLEARLAETRAAAESGDDVAIERMIEAETAFRLAGGHSIDERIGEVLHGLGFGKDDWERSCATFSGGWQMRIALARLLLSEPNVLLLDEPTNHLDLHARSWLASWLDRSPHALLVVSHDRHLLDRVCRRVVEVRSRTTSTYTGNFTSYVKQREQRIAEQQAAYEAQQGEIARLERFVERFGAKATKASQAQSRQKVLDGMERIEAPEREGRPRLRLPPAPSGSVELVSLRKADLGWPDGPIVAKGVELTIERGMRLAVLGPNGAGKSTLLHTLSGRLALRAGQRRVGKDVRIGVFGQDQAQELPSDGLPVDLVLMKAPRATPGQARAALGALGLHGEAALRPVGSLSGGEKARVALAGFAIQEHDLLLLDEPTNHLDAVTVHVLAEALAAFDGGLMVVTHDRWLVEQVATHVAIVAGGEIVIREGVRPTDFEPIAASRVAANVTNAEGAEKHADRKRRARERDRVERRIAKVGEEIAALEARQAAIDEEMFEVAADYAKVTALNAERGRVDTAAAAAWAEWERLEAELAELGDGT